jgi:hypothetical protein
MNLSGTMQNTKVTVNDSTYSLPAAVKVKRSKHSLPITVISDSVTKQAVVEPGMSPTFFYANIWLLEFSPSLGLHHQFLDFFSFGATYNPMFYSVFTKGQWQYQHTISIELIFRIPLNRDFTPDLHLFD